MERLKGFRGVRRQIHYPNNKIRDGKKPIDVEIAGVIFIYFVQDYTCFATSQDIVYERANLIV